jgi:hypothetical protein
MKKLIIIIITIIILKIKINKTMYLLVVHSIIKNNKNKYDKII